MRDTHPDIKSREVFERQFEVHGGTDSEYLARHYQRFAETFTEYASTRDASKGNRVLDIGAHWLHQSVMWAQAGFEVTALDMPATLGSAMVKSIASETGIRLVSSTDLETADAFNELEDSSFDIILFTEIIEHLTFNPVRLWEQVYRVLKVGGRVLVTTPNYYAWNGRAWNFIRFLRRFGGGISVDEILGVRTYGHHWREFSKREVIRYFSLLSPDFEAVKAIAVHDFHRNSRGMPRRTLQGLIESIPGLRPHLHLEFELQSRDSGVVLSPSW